MKTIQFFYFIIFILLSNELTVAQKITPGTYRLVFGIDKFTNTPIFESEYSIRIIIQNDSLFSYDLREDIGSSLGKGFYSLINGELVLKFDKMTLPLDTFSFNVLQSDRSIVDSIEYIFLVRDGKDNTPLSGASLKLLFLNEQIHDSDKTFKSFSTDENGFTRVVISKQKLPIKIFVAYIGYDDVTFTYGDSLNSKIAINMYYSSSRIAIDSGKTITYKIKDIGEDSFYLKGKFLYKWAYFMKIN